MDDLSEFTVPEPGEASRPVTVAGRRFIVVPVPEAGRVADLLVTTFDPDDIRFRSPMADPALDLPVTADGLRTLLSLLTVAERESALPDIPVSLRRLPDPIFRGLLS